MKRNLAMMAIATLGSIGMAAVGTSHSIGLEAEPVLKPNKKKRVAVTSFAARASRGRMPHIGAKERARHAGKPDGPMHGLPPRHRANA